MKKLVLILISCQLWSLWLIPAVQAQTEPFYKGKTLRIVIGFPPGGIVDLWARFIAQYMGRYIPGTPDLIVQNMPGGGSMIGPPNVPAERLKLLREAYAKTLSDPDFLADAKKREWDVERISGEELEAMAKKAVSQPADTVERLKKIMGK